MRPASRHAAVVFLCRGSPPPALCPHPTRRTPKHEHHAATRLPDNRRSVNRLFASGVLRSAIRVPNPRSVQDADYASHEMRYYWESRYLIDLSGLSDEAIDVLVELNEPLPPRTRPSSVQQAGRMSRVAGRRRPWGTAPRRT